MNNLRAMLNLLGLRDNAACKFLGISQKSLSSMVTGRRKTPEGVLEELSFLHNKLIETAKKLVYKIDELAIHDNKIHHFTLGISTNDEDAQKIGWPSHITHGIMGALVVLNSKNIVTLVDRIICECQSEENYKNGGITLNEDVKLLSE